MAQVTVTHHFTWWVTVIDVNTHVPLLYAFWVASGQNERVPNPATPRMAVVRSFADMKHVVGLLQANRAVLIVLRTESSERRRCLDLLAGWALGSGGDADEISPNALMARPPGAPPARLAGSEIVSSVEAAFEHESSPLDRAEEDRLIALAGSGSDEARRQLADFYSELTAVLALALRPEHKSQATAQREAQEELDRIVAWPPRGAPLLVSLTNAIYERLNT